MLIGGGKQRMIEAGEALAGRDHRVFPVPAAHAVLGTPLEPPFPDGLERLVVGMGCFWGAERLFWQTEGVYTTAPTTCSGRRRRRAAMPTSAS
jgi:peptide-methionine (S)-S-oxide reductase